MAYLGGVIQTPEVDIQTISDELGIVKTPAHVVLFLLVAAENADFPNPGVEEFPQDGMTERAGASGDQ